MSHWVILGVRITNLGLISALLKAREFSQHHNGSPNMRDVIANFSVLQCSQVCNMHHIQHAWRMTMETVRELSSIWCMKHVQLSCIAYFSCPLFQLTKLIKINHFPSKSISQNRKFSLKSPEVLKLITGNKSATVSMQQRLLQLIKVAFHWNITPIIWSVRLDRWTEWAWLMVLNV